MNEYKRPYYLLFNGISEVVCALENAVISMNEQDKEAVETQIFSLRKLQQSAEEVFIAENE